MLRTLLRPLHGTTVSASARSDVARILQRSRPVRCLLISCLSVAAGWGLLTLLLPALSAESIATITDAHLPASGTPPLFFWIRLCASRFPFWLLLALAGFTRFSGGLTSAVTVYRGVCDGAVFGLMSAAARNPASLSLPQGFTVSRIALAFALWAVVDLAIRLLMTLEARRVAGMEWMPLGGDGRMAPAVQAAVKRYLTLCLTGLLATAAICGVYTAFLYI